MAVFLKVPVFVPLFINEVGYGGYFLDFILWNSR